MYDILHPVRYVMYMLCVSMYNKINAMNINNGADPAVEGGCLGWIRKRKERHHKHVCEADKHVCVYIHICP